MKAAEIMTHDVVTVHPDTPVVEVARLLLQHAISAVPVIDETGAPVGIVSEGDLIGRDDTSRDARRDWWLSMLAEGEGLSPDFLDQMRRSETVARDVMSAPVVTIDEQTDAGAIARLLQAYRIKRVPVLHDGRIVGIVSRANLLRALAGSSAPEQHRGGGFLASALAGLDARFGHHAAPEPTPAAASAEPPDPSFDAVAFRKLAEAFQSEQARHRQDLQREAAEQRRRKAAQILDDHISDETWHGLLHQARRAAARGEKDFMLLRFPSQVCSDGGRAINAMTPDWPATLRGDAAEIYLRWERELKPLGFHLAAQVIEFPGGLPGDIGLFLSWGI